MNAVTSYMKNKWQKHLCTGFIAASAIFSGIAAAAPQNGIGTYVGLISATEGGSRSKGLSLGMDAQFTINDNWSVVPYLMVSAERDSASRTVADGLAGLQARRWFGDWFVGGHVFDHDWIVFSNGKVQCSAYGSFGLAMGVLAGFEYASGWGAEVQTDSLESVCYNTTTDIRRNAVRLHLTYRWR
jgi:hypothetical protein